MLNERLADTPLFCRHDIDVIAACAVDELFDTMKQSGEELLSSNKIVTIFLAHIECYLHDAVGDTLDIRA